MNDLTVGNPWKVILRLTIPIIVGNIFQQLYNISDTLIVGRTLGVDALAAVGSTGSINFLVLGFVGGFSSGMAIVTAQRVGANDWEATRKSFAMNLWGGLFLTIILTIISLAFINPLLRLMQTPADIFADAQLFIAIILIGTFATMGYNIMANILRAVGDAKTPLYILIIALIANMVIEAVLIMVFHWGVDGAAWATVVAQAGSAVLSMFYINWKIPQLRLSWNDLKFDWQEMKIHMRAGVPLGFQQSVIAIGSITLSAAVNTLGTDAVAANTAASKPDQIIIWVVMAFGVTMATYVAQNYGAKKYDRIITGLKAALWMSMSIGAVLGVLEIVFGRDLVQLFISGTATHVVDLAQLYFWANGPLYAFLALLFVLRYALQGLGDVKTPTWAGFGELFARTIASFTLVIWFGFFGASLANPFAWFCSLAFLLPATIRNWRGLRSAETLDESSTGESLKGTGSKLND